MISGVGLAQRRDRGVEFVLRRTGATQSPDALGEEAFRIVERFRLNVLAQRQRNRPALGRIGEHRHGALQRVDDLLGPRDAVEIARHGTKAIVCGNGAVAEILDLLQDGIGPAIGEDVAGQQKKRQTVHCATAAAVTMFVAPGPIELVTAIIRRRKLALAKAIAACAIACSLCAR